MEKEKEFTTTDMALYGYMMMRSQTDSKVKMVFKRFNKGGEKKFEFIFDDPEDQADWLKVEFINSDCKIFDSFIRDVKKILF